MNETPKFELFISYRRDGGVDYARMIYLELKGRGYNTFFDFNSLRSGKFNDGIFKAIDECRYFILVLSKNALDRCMNENDWVRKEIEYALSKGKEIIPICPSGGTRGFPAEMPASLDPLRNIQVSRLELDDLFEKSFDKIIEDRFEETFRKGRSPTGTMQGVSNKSFTKVGWSVVGAILIAAATVTVAIMKFNNASDNPYAEERAIAKSNDLQWRMMRLDQIKVRLSRLDQNGWNPNDDGYVAARALCDEIWDDATNKKFTVADKKLSDADRMVRILTDRLMSQKLISIENELDEEELQGDERLEKKLALIREIAPIMPSNDELIKIMREAEDIFYPRMVVSTVCDGKEVPAELSLEVPVIGPIGPCVLCKVVRNRKEIDRFCTTCSQIPPNREYVEVYRGQSLDFVDKTLVGTVEPSTPSTTIKSPKEVMASKGDVLGSISAKYVTEDGSIYTAKTGKIVANWVGTTNVVIELKARENVAAGEVRIVPLPHFNQMEFVWCPPGSFDFEYRDPRSGLMKQERITVKTGFWISKYECSGAQASSLGMTSYLETQEHPALLDGYQACKFAKEFQDYVGDGAMVRIPTAEEWELAAHYGNHAVTEENIHEYGWVDEPGKPYGPYATKWDLHGQGEKQPTGLGLFDMYGNAEEWTIGSIDESIGLGDPSWGFRRRDNDPWTKMTIRGGSIRVAASNAVQVLTRYYLKGRPMNAFRMEQRNGGDNEEIPQNHWYTVRLVADELPPYETMANKHCRRHWICTRCGEFAIDVNEPNKLGCTAHAWERAFCKICGIKKSDWNGQNDCNSELHTWEWVADVGDEKYICKYCQKELKSYSTPKNISASYEGIGEICPGPTGDPTKRKYHHEWKWIKE